MLRMTFSKSSHLSHQAALCLLHQERYISFLWYAKKSNFSLQGTSVTVEAVCSVCICNLLAIADYEIMLCSAPSIGLGRCLTMPPHPYQPLLTVAEARYLSAITTAANNDCTLTVGNATASSCALCKDSSTSFAGTLYYRGCRHNFESGGGLSERA